MNVDENVDIIIRPRLFFSDIVNSKNLLCKLPRFKKFVDEKNSCTDIRDIPKAIEALVSNRQHGIFNVCCEGYMSIYEMAKLLGIDGLPFSGDDLINQEKLYLVNNIMSLEKLNKFYKTRNLKKSIMECWRSIHNK
jgi:hypothetical protein